MSWNFTVDDTSPLVAYTPYGDGVGTTNGWAQWFSGTGFVHNGGDSGSGTTGHATSLNGAQIDLDFYGEAIYLYGVSNGSYSVTLDGTTSKQDGTSDQNIYTSPDLVLFSQDGLTIGNHHITVLFQGGSSNAQMIFDDAVITKPLASGLEAPATLVVDNTNTSVLQYSGDWFTSTDHQVRNFAPYHESKTSGSTVSFQFQGSAIGVNGTRNWGHWLYEVSVDGESTTLNGSTFWILPDTLLYYKDGLDPAQTHTINVTDTSDSDFTFSLNSFTVFQTNSNSPPTAGSISTTDPSSTSSSSSSPTSTAAGATKGSSKVGIIAGPVIAVLVILGLVAGFFLWRRHRNRNRVNRPIFLDAEVVPFPNSYGVAPIDHAAVPSEVGQETASLSAFSSEKRPFMTNSQTSSPAVSIYDRGAIAKANSSTPDIALRALPTPPGLIRTHSDGDSLHSHSASNAGTNGISSQITHTDVDRIIEMISQRMGPPEAGVPPPQYLG